jgi:hypothetical protein
MAAQDEIDVSTAEKFDEYLWTWWSTSAMRTARDVLKGLDDGEGH